MRVTVDLLDTQLLVYAANETDDWATTLHRQILGGQRYV